MKKFWLMLMCLWMLCPCVHGEEEKMYEVKTRKEFYLLDAVQGQMVENILKNVVKSAITKYMEQLIKQQLKTWITVIYISKIQWHY